MPGLLASTYSSPRAVFTEAEHEDVQVAVHEVEDPWRAVPRVGLVLLHDEHDPSVAGVEAVGVVTEHVPPVSYDGRAVPR